MSWRRQLLARKSLETILAGSLHCGNGPIVSTGAVLVRSGMWIGLSWPAAIASAR